LCSEVGIDCLNYRDGPFQLGIGAFQAGIAPGQSSVDALVRDKDVGMVGALGAAPLLLGSTMSFPAVGM
jgi:hypothetical protein